MSKGTTDIWLIAEGIEGVDSDVGGVAEVLFALHSGKEAPATVLTLPFRLFPVAVAYRFAGDSDLVGSQTGGGAVPILQERPHFRLGKFIALSRRTGPHTAAPGLLAAQQVPHRGGHPFPFPCQPDPRPAPLQKGKAQLLLHHRNGVADGRRRKMQLLGRFVKAALPRHRVKDLV